ncbi:MAG: hypothetical protein ACLFNW_10580 [Desulfobacterales bacterium]
MSPNFIMDSRKNHQGLHVEVRGDFDGNSACELVNLLHEKYDGSGDVVIDCRRLGKICQFGCGTFMCRLNFMKIPAKRLVFHGQKAKLLAPSGSRIHPGSGGYMCRCNGKCLHCKCIDKIKDFPEQEIEK